MIFNAIGTPTYPQMLRRLFGMQGQPSTPSLANEIQAEVDLFARPELWALFGGSPFWSGVLTGGAVAAQFSGIGVRNPTGSGVLVVVMGAYMSPAAAAFAVYQRRGAGVASSQASSTSVFGTDSRLTGPFGGGGPFFGTTHATAGIGGAGFVGPLAQNFPQNTRIDLPPFVLAPGSEMAFFHNTVNTAIGGNIFGMYRQANDQELFNL